MFSALFIVARIVSFGLGDDPVCSDRWGGKTGSLLDLTGGNVHVNRGWAENSPQRSFKEDVQPLLALAGAKGLLRKLEGAFIFQILLLQLACLSCRPQAFSYIIY